MVVLKAILNEKAGLMNVPKPLGSNTVSSIKSFVCLFVVAILFSQDKSFAQSAPAIGFSFSPSTLDGFSFSPSSLNRESIPEITVPLTSNMSGPTTRSPRSLDELGIDDRNGQIFSAVGSLKHSDQLRGLPNPVWAEIQGSLRTEGTSIVVGVGPDSPVPDANSSAIDASTSAVEPTRAPLEPSDPLKPREGDAQRYTDAIRSGGYAWEAMTGAEVALNAPDRSVSGINQTNSVAGDSPYSSIDRRSVVLRLTAIAPDDGIKRSGAKTIYGSDDRTDYYQIPDKEIKTLANGVASISNWSERHVSARGICNAFLISRDLAITASHCVGFGDYRNLAIRFNDQIVAAGPRPGDLDVYEIDDVLTWDQLHDFAVIRIKSNLNGTYPGDKYPVLRISENPPQVGKPVFMIGSPGGEYKKFSPNCSVVRDTYVHKTGKITFGIDCEAFGGNSGSPVFDGEENSVLGVFWGGQSDTKAIPLADSVLHEFVVPFDRILSAPSFDVGEWPLSASPSVGTLYSGDQLAAQ